MAHELFMSMGNQVGVEQKTTISTLETLGMIAVVGGVAYGSVKAYQMYTHTTPKSVEQRLNEKIDQLEARLNHKINNVQNHLTSNQITISNQVEHTRVNLVQLTGEFQKQNIDHFTLVGGVLVDVKNQLTYVQQSLNNLTQRIEENQTQMNVRIKYTTE
jgi:gas vesicle protein